jgi:hypothetical protein
MLEDARPECKKGTRQELITDFRPAVRRNESGSIGRRSGLELSLSFLARIPMTNRAHRRRKTASSIRCWSGRCSPPETCSATHLSAGKWRRRLLSSGCASAASNKLLWIHTVGVATAGQTRSTELPISGCPAATPKVSRLVLALTPITNQHSLIQQL